MITCERVDKTLSYIKGEVMKYKYTTDGRKVVNEKKIENSLTNIKRRQKLTKIEEKRLKAYK